jgi:hypothetical protein
VRSVKTTKSVIHVYHKGAAREDASDVDSFLYSYITHTVPARVTKLRLFSRCVGQRENLAVIHLNIAVVDTSIFGNAQQFFPPTSLCGRTYVYDRNFGLV